MVTVADAAVSPLPENPAGVLAGAAAMQDCKGSPATVVMTMASLAV